MAEEIETQNSESQNDESKPAHTPIDDKSVKEHPSFKKLSGSLTKVSDELKALKAEREAEKRTLELEKAKATQSVEELLKQKQEELESYKAQVARQSVEFDLKTKANALGVKSQIVLDGLVARLHKESPEDIDSWLGEIPPEELGLSANEKAAPGNTGPTAPRVTKSTAREELVNKVKSGKADRFEIAKVMKMLGEGKLQLSDLEK
jgi:hypothetical protein